MRFLLAVAWVLLAWAQGGRAAACEGVQQSTAWLRAVASEADATSFAQLGWNFSINAKSKLFDHDPCKERWPRVGCDATTGCLVSLDLSRLLRAMAAHRSQLVWFRVLFLLFSRFSYLNSFAPAHGGGGGGAVSKAPSSSFSYPSSGGGGAGASV
jgi:hypothetical protein